MSTKKKSSARKRAARKKPAGKHNSQKKIQSKRVMALNHQRDSLRLAEPVASSDEATDRPFRPKHSAIGSTPQAQVENAVKSGPDSADPLVVAEEPAPIVTAFESQMHLFAMMLRWSPLAILLQQQALVAQMISNMRYPMKSEPTCNGPSER
jgi:hypothetical protein